MDKYCVRSFEMYNISNGHSTHHQGQNNLDMLEKSAKVYIGRLKMIVEYYEEMARLALVIQVDIGGHPPFPNGSRQFSCHFGNLLFLAGFHFRGPFEDLNEVFLRLRFSMIAEGMIEPPK